jgi:hypothetical protein
MTRRKLAQAAKLVAIRLLFGVLSLSVLAADVAVAKVPVTYRTIALSTDQAPGLSPGVSVGNIASPVINVRGEAVFNSRVNRPGTNNFAIWSHGPAGLVNVMIEATQPPDLPTGIVWDDSSSRVLLNDNGQMLIQGNVRGSGINTSNDQGYWFGGPGTLELIAREEGTSLNNAPVFDFLSQFVSMNGHGEVGFVSRQAGVNGIWFGPPGGLLRIMSAGDPAPGTEPGVFFSGFDVRWPLVNDSGFVAFREDLI